MALNLLLCAGSIIFFFGGAELIARIWYTPQKYEYTGMFEYDREKVFGLKKNATGLYWGGAYTTNSYGFRGKEIPLEKPANTVRVLVVGDSVSFGHGVNDDQIFSYILEQSLNEYLVEQESAIAAEVINTSVPGNSPFQEYHDMKRGLAFSPDIIVLQITLNDIIEPFARWIFRDMGMEEGDLEIISHDYVLGIHNISNLDHILRQRSALYLFLKDIAARIRFKDPTGANIAQKAAQKENFNAALLVLEPENPEVIEEWENALSWIRHMTALAREQDIPFVILATPFDFQLTLEKKFAYPQQKLREFSEEKDSYFVDLLDILWLLLVEQTDKEKTANQIIAEWRQDGSRLLQDFWEVFFLDYDHLSAAGHELVASVLQPVILNALHLGAE